MTSIAHFTKEFLFHCEFEKNLSTKTTKAYLIDLEQFRDFLEKTIGQSILEEIDRSVLRAYLETLTSKYKVKTVKRKLATLKAFFNFLEFEDILESNPMRKLRIRIKEPFVLPKVLTLSEIQVLFEYMYKQKAESKFADGYAHKALVRDIAILELLFATGIRVSELCSLKPDQIDLESGIVKVFGKGRKERIIHFGVQKSIEAVKAYHTAFKPELMHASYFFINRLNQGISPQSVRLMIRKYARAAGLKKHVTPHTFRHTFATLLMEEGVDIKYIQHFLGHSSIMTTQIYTHVSGKMQEEILLNMHPRGKLGV